MTTPKTLVPDRRQRLHLPGLSRHPVAFRLQGAAHQRRIRFHPNAAQARGRSPPGIRAPCASTPRGRPSATTSTPTTRPTVRPCPRTWRSSCPISGRSSRASTCRCSKNPAMKPTTSSARWRCRRERQGFTVIMVTGDKDFMQLMADNATIWDPMKDKTVDPGSHPHEYGVEPRQMIDVMGLSGDTSDNVPGVPGIGPKTARQLDPEIRTWKNCTAGSTPSPRNKQHENLVANREQAFLSRRLVTIDTRRPSTSTRSVSDRSAGQRRAVRNCSARWSFDSCSRLFQAASDLSAKRYHCHPGYRGPGDGARKGWNIRGFLPSIRKRPQKSHGGRSGGRFLCPEARRGLLHSLRPRLPGRPGSAAPALVVATGSTRTGRPDDPQSRPEHQIRLDSPAAHGIDLAGVVFDTMLASYLLNPSKRAHSLDQIALDFLDHKTITYEDVTGKSKPAVGLRPGAPGKSGALCLRRRGHHPSGPARCSAGELTASAYTNFCTRWKCR